MTLFYFNLRTGKDLVEDADGAECESLAAARNKAISSAREIMSGRIMAGKAADDSQFEITDESGRIILIVPFKDAIRL